MKHDVDPTITFIAISVIVVIAMIAAIVKGAKENERKKKIYAKYGNSELANRLVEKVIWTGMTIQQLRDSWGDPLVIDEKVLKTKKKEVWKYVRKGENRYGLRVTIENNVVIGWDEKS